MQNPADGKILHLENRAHKPAPDLCRRADMKCVTDPQQPVRVHLSAMCCVGELGTSGVPDQTVQGDELGLGGREPAQLMEG